MFKYGSIRLFFIKIITGFLSAGFGLVLIGSLLTHNKNDPGFKTLLDNEKVENFFGLFGSYLSSYFLVLVGSLSYLLAIFTIIEGIKGMLGIKNSNLILKFISNIFGIFFIGVFTFKYGINNFNDGLISVFISDFFEEQIHSRIQNGILTYFLNLIIFIIGILLIAFSFSIKYRFLNNFFKIFRFLKFLKYLNIFLPIILSLKKRSDTKLSRSRNEPTIKKASVFIKKESIIKNQNTSTQIEIDDFKFKLPNKNLLTKSPVKNGLAKEINKLNNDLADKLERTLAEYGVEGNVTGFKTGPIVTLFEFIPNAGIKSSKIIGLSEDIARAMSSLSARIASQPGKTSLGIEIPNSKRDGVFFGDLIEDERFTINESALTLALGKDISGEKIFTDLEKMPHLLIAGTTGSGKSVGINTMILSLLYKFKPNECKLILIDPKMLELSIYEDIPHLLTPVVTDPKKAVFALKWVVREMENRYKLMSSVNVKNISSYNNKVIRTISSGRKLFREVQTGIDPDTRIPITEKKEIKLEKMPFIVVVIDEMADLMMVAGKEVETLVQRLAQMARASGIHLITATQRPSVDVITGTIKANFPSRISYKVASKFDSRTILNEMGAEQLLGSGDMLLLENGGNIKRLHGGFVSETEVEKVVSSIKNQATFDYKKEISFEEKLLSNELENDLISNNQDDLYGKAVDIVVKQQKVSTSYIQRYLQIGYNRAARIVEKMEEDGIISEANNAGKRHVLKK